MALRQQQDGDDDDCCRLEQHTVDHHLVLLEPRGARPFAFGAVEILLRGLEEGDDAASSPKRKRVVFAAEEADADEMDFFGGDAPAGGHDAFATQAVNDDMLDLETQDLLNNPDMMNNLTGKKKNGIDNYSHSIACVSG